LRLRQKREGSGQKGAVRRERGEAAVAQSYAEEAQRGTKGFGWSDGVLG